MCIMCRKTDNILRKKNQEQNKKENVFLFFPQWNKTELNQSPKLNVMQKSN